MENDKEMNEELNQATNPVMAEEMAWDINAEPDHEFTIIECLDAIQETVNDSELPDNICETLEFELTLLTERLDMTPREVILLAVMCEIGDAATWNRIAEFLGVSRLKAMSLTPELDDLIKRRWVRVCSVHEGGGRRVAFSLVYGVIRDLRNNKTFEPEKLDGLSQESFLMRIDHFMRTDARDRDIPDSENMKWLMALAEFNPHLPLCQEVAKLDEESGRILMLAVADYVIHGGEDGEGITSCDLNTWVNDDGFSAEMTFRELVEGDHCLVQSGWLEPATEDGLADFRHIRLTAKARNEFTAGFAPHNRLQHGRNEYALRHLKQPHDIKAHKMFYNNREQEQLKSIKRVLSADGYEEVCARLEECGLRKGITCLFYGGPGTGKTETVLQLARETGRPVMQIDIAGMRDKFVGETEKNIKQVFTRYRDLCENTEVTPILFFNEADGIFGKRFDTTRSSVEKMDNAMQNIILQEMESLDGILIATTNLTGALDDAFDRRFLFKVEFEKPCMAAKYSIWETMLPELDFNAVVNLAKEFDFSGGQIENIARKSKIDYIINGEKPTFDRLRQFCLDETLNRSSRAKIGF